MIPPRAALLLLLVLASPTAAYGGGTDCPPHAQHCNFAILELLDGARLDAEARVELDVTANAPATVAVELGARAQVVVRVTLNSTSANRTVNATVTVNDTWGVAFDAPTNRTQSVTTRAPAVYRFAFDTDDALAQGDVLFIPVTLQAEGKSTHGHAPLQVAGSSLWTAGTLVIPLVVGLLLGGAVGAGGTYYTLRKRG